MGRESGCKSSWKRQGPMLNRQKAALASIAQQWTSTIALVLALPGESGPLAWWRGARQRHMQVKNSPSEILTAQSFRSQAQCNGPQEVKPLPANISKDPILYTYSRYRKDHTREEGDTSEHPLFDFTMHSFRRNFQNFTGQYWPQSGRLAWQSQCQWPALGQARPWQSQCQWPALGQCWPRVQVELQ
jgi:hypothetical protein